MASYAEATGKTHGKATAYEDLESAVKNAWLVFEVVPEKLNIKIETFAELEKVVREREDNQRTTLTVS